MTWWQLGHAIFVSIHAVAATIGLGAGILALWKGRGLRVHQIAVVTLAGCLLPSMSLGWQDFTTANRVVFAGLLVLAAFMVVQAIRAGVIRRREIASRTVLEHSRIGPGFIRVVGFNVIALVAGGTVVPVLRMGGGAIGVIVSVGAAVGLAHLLVELRRTRVRSQIAKHPNPLITAD